MSVRRSHAFASVLAVALVALVAVATAALAAEGGDGSEGAEGAWLSLLFSVVNFSIFVFLLRKYAWPAVKDFLARRHVEVAEAMAAAEKARLEAEAIRAEFTQKEAALEETRRRMLDELRRGAEADRQKALADAAAAGERLKSEASRQAEHDLARARRELRAEAARLATDIAEREARAKLTDADRARLLREFVEGIAKP
ncbi:MAG TPA: ATP synthase F0 subunit B [Candidatus Binatia bacterium]|jgi:F-type H+-transporting ATPase subunit b